MNINEAYYVYLIWKNFNPAPGCSAQWLWILLLLLVFLWSLHCTSTLLPIRIWAHFSIHLSNACLLEGVLVLVLLPGFWVQNQKAQFAPAVWRGHYSEDKNKETHCNHNQCYSQSCTNQDQDTIETRDYHDQSKTQNKILCVKKITIQKKTRNNISFRQGIFGSLSN